MRLTQEQKNTYAGIRKIKREYKRGAEKMDQEVYEKKVEEAVERMIYGKDIDEDIKLYISLHKDKTDDLFIHCDIMKKVIWNMVKLRRRA